MGSYVQLIFLCVVNIIFMISGIVLNTLVIISLLKHPHLRKKLCNFMILVLSCFDQLTVITNHPLLVVELVLWLNEKYDLLSNMMIYGHFSTMVEAFSMYALLVMNIERYLGVSYPYFHRRSVTKGRLLKLLAILIVLQVILATLSANYVEVIPAKVALMIFALIYVPPLMFINYKLFMISRKMRRNNAVVPGKRRLFVSINLKNISTCLLTVACLVLFVIPAFIYLALITLNKKSSSKSVMLSFIWARTMATMNCTFDSLIFFWKNKVLRTEGSNILKTLKDRLFT